MIPNNEPRVEVQPACNAGEGGRSKQGKRCGSYYFQTERALLGAESRDLEAQKCQTFLFMEWNGKKGKNPKNSYFQV